MLRDEVSIEQPIISVALEPCMFLNDAGVFNVALVRTVSKALNSGLRLNLWNWCCREHMARLRHYLQHHGVLGHRNTLDTDVSSALDVKALDAHVFGVFESNTAFWFTPCFEAYLQKTGMRYPIAQYFKETTPQDFLSTYLTLLENGVLVNHDVMRRHLYA